ncbi:uncharacterized mitochondrial protein AtMg00820-like [Cannabis sativa]|uniref:uncharacterized mitochondrial protein AtMg00820-like n=1 Tax=Cannabis sativa TaxID=3483 RepID=UPI0029CA3AD7|nr:uncharacterized mitochondrial protein AtMg00820-like [Cannabis sativa]
MPALEVQVAPALTVQAGLVTAENRMEPLLTPKFRAAVLATAKISESTSYAPACRQKVWTTKMDVEIDALEKNHTLIIVTLPDGQYAIDNKWIYKIKYNPDASVERCKARLVAKGYTQKPCIDYFDTYAPMAKFNTLKLLFALSAINN